MTELENIKDILARRVDQLDTGRHDVMTEAKLVILEAMRVEVQIIGFTYGTLRVATEDSAAASEIRLHAPTLISKINDKIKPSVVQKITVRVR